MKSLFKIVTALILCTAFTVHASGFDFAKRYHNQTEQSASSRITISYPSKPTNKAKMQLNLLRKNEEYGRRYFNAAIEQAALDKIALVSGANSKVYMLAFVKFKLKQGLKGREQALDTIKKRCEIGDQSYECVQAKAMYDMADPKMKMDLQKFIFAEEHRNYKDAVKEMDTLLGIPVEHDLRYRYYVMMGNIEKRELEAIKGLEKIISEIPYETAFASDVRKTLITLKANYKANRAIANIDNPRKTKRAQKELLDALKLDPKNSNAEYWKEILRYSKYYRTIEIADKLQSKGKYTQAIVAYNKAIKIDKNFPYAYVGLLRIYAALDDDSNFNKYAALANKYAKNESKSERARIASLINSLRAEKYIKIASGYEKDGKFDKALENYLKAYKLDSKNPWVLYNLASCYIALNENDKAVELFERQKKKHKRDIEFNYAYALILDKLDRTQDAIDTVKRFKGKDKSVDELLVRLNNTLKINAARMYAEQKNNQKAKELLDGIDMPEAKVLLADIHYEEGNLDKAQYLLEDVTSKDKDTLYPRVKLATIYTDKQENDKAKELLDELFERQDELSLDNKRALATLFEQNKDYENAQKVYINSLVNVYDNGKSADDYDSQKLLSKVQTYNNEDKYTVAWLLRNAAINNQNLKSSTPSDSKLYKDALAVLNNKQGYEDNSEYTKDLRTPDEKIDWLKQSIISNGAQKYNNNNVVLSGAIRFLKDSGHPGYSDNKGIQSLLKLTFPLFNGQATIQTDRTTINAGALQGGEYNDLFGNCFVSGCNDFSDRKATAQTYAFGFDNDDFHIDIGTAPNISSNKRKTNAIVGGAYYNFDVKDFSFRVGAHRRAKDNSVLAYYGDTDPISRMKFGAVKKNGLDFSASLYINEDSGIWSTLAIDSLKGTNVQSNNSVVAMAGYYYHLLNKPNERITLSPNLLFMKYSKDLSGYTFGQGGYYSPQFYLGQGLSLAYMKRFNNTSIYVELNGSVSRSKTKGIDRYPVKVADIPDLYETSSTSSTTSFGGGIRLAIEQRVYSHLVVGLQAAAVKAEDYSPVNITAYFRYYFDSWMGDLYMPPKAPTPYVEW